jgi:phytoene desaturase
MDVGTVAGWLPSHPLARRVARLRPSSAARVAWWVVEGPPPAATHHGLHFDRGEEPLYVAMPTVTDPALAPGHTIVHAVLHHPAADGGSPCGADGEMLESVPRRLGARGMWPAGRVVARGADGDGTPCYGYAVGPGLVRAFPPSQRVRGLANLVLAGGSVFPGPGVANTVRSGLRAADLALGALA